MHGCAPSAVFCNEDEAQAFLDGFAGSTAVAQAAQHQASVHWCRGSGG